MNMHKEIFNSLIGNENTKKELENMIEAHKLPHAILLEGEEGLGKSRLAVLIAAAYFSSGPEKIFLTEEKIISRNFPDIIFPETSGISENYSVETIRKIRKEAYIKPNQSFGKVYIIEDIDSISILAQNALLKILEEPPENIIFILTCINSSNLLKTLKSRMFTFKITIPNKPQALQFLENKFKKIEKEKIQEALNISNGNIGKAIAFLKEHENNKNFGLIENLALNLFKSKNSKLLHASAFLVKNKKEFKESLITLKLILRDCLIFLNISKTNQNVKFSQNNKIKEISINLSTNKIIEIMEIIDKTIALLEQNVNINLAATFFVSKV